MSKVLLFTNGDSNDPSIWSNVPYLFAKTLEGMGYEVLRHSLTPPRWMTIVYNRLVRPFHCFGDVSKNYSFLRTGLYLKYTDRKIKKIVSESKNVDFCVFMSYEFYNRYNDIPSVLFGDWTYQILLERQLGNSEFSKAENRFIEYQHKVLSSANYVFTLFQTCADAIRKECPSANVIHIDGNVVNDMNDEAIPEDIISQKAQSRHILFVGNVKYKEGCLAVVKALVLLPEEYSLDVIGLTADQLGVNSPRVHCYGYLRKGIEEERRTYYRLMSQACLFVNPTPGWAGYSSTVEAMYYYTPVVVSPYDEFVTEFGKQIEFGRYADNISPRCLALLINSLVEDTDYRLLCERSHNRVESFSWCHYVNQLLDIVENR